MKRSFVGFCLFQATEHMLGCVLCAPGCFSLYRASSLLDDNVMRKFTSVADDANQILQWDLGNETKTWFYVMANYFF